ncbi:Hypp7970 [Branchiostoma lanceolatum]|uniref:Hypp7970 protein n=1 Tax=Branchiostoma lanceolatum TaxID=7740 RepID=A0A8J9Z5S0_BRALA|nr:Hypp7970 [Branchiostoma lanceolatum]
MKPYAIPVRVLPCRVVKDAKMRALKDELKRTMEEIGMVVVDNADNPLPVVGHEAVPLEDVVWLATYMREQNVSFETAIHYLRRSHFPDTYDPLPWTPDPVPAATDAEFPRREHRGDGGGRHQPTGDRAARHAGVSASDPAAAAPLPSPPKKKPDPNTVYTAAAMEEEGTQLPFSFVQLITQAITLAEDKRLTTS